MCPGVKWIYCSRLFHSSLATAPGRRFSLFFSLPINSQHFRCSRSCGSNFDGQNKQWLEGAFVSSSLGSKCLRIDATQLAPENWSIFMAKDSSQTLLSCFFFFFFYGRRVWYLIHAARKGRGDYIHWCIHEAHLLSVKPTAVREADEPRVRYRNSRTEVFFFFHASGLRLFARLFSPVYFPGPFWHDAYFILATRLRWFDSLKIKKHKQKTKRTQYSQSVWFKKRICVSISNSFSPSRKQNGTITSELSIAEEQHDPFLMRQYVYFLISALLVAETLNGEQTLASSKSNPSSQSEDCGWLTITNYEIGI